jgi:hypothetical protein
MLNFEEFFTACTGLWKTERIYHSIVQGGIERSYTEYTVEALRNEQKQQILSVSAMNGIKVDREQQKDAESACPGFAIAFDTVSETGERVAMSLKALFVPDAYALTDASIQPSPPPPVAAMVPDSEEIIRGYYLRDEGYSEAGAIAGRFTYLPTRQTLEMTTYYGRSVAIDQMRIVAPDLRLRTILTYKRPEQPDQPPTIITLAGFGVERRQSL